MAAIEVRGADSSDKAAMLTFLSEHWRDDHIFVQAPETFDWQYKRADGGYNIVLAITDGIVLGFLGYIPTGQFDARLGQDEVLLAIWKVRDDMAPPGLGIRMLKLIEKTRPRVIGAIGISDMVEPIYKVFRYTVGQLHHSALFVPDVSTTIAKNIPEDAFASLAKHPDWWLGSLKGVAAVEIDTLAQAGPGLVKSADYLDSRYVSHPWYDYTIQGIFEDRALRSILVWRRVEAQGSAILRIVDIIGPADGLIHVAPSLRKAVISAGADYIDLMQTGLDVSLLRRAGFVSPEDYPDLILPNYFAPFEARNINIKLSYRCFHDPDRQLALYRADSDQDRPNQPSELTRHRQTS